MIRTTDHILGPVRGTEAQAQKIAQTNRDRDYFREVFRLAPLVGIDPSIVIAQWHVETAGGTSGRWTRNGNPAGLGIEEATDPDPATFTGVEAARVHLWALLIACDAPAAGSISLVIPDSAMSFCKRWDAKYRDPKCPTVVTIDDLNIRYVDATGEPQATWAWDSEYQDTIVQRGNAIFPSIIDQGVTPVADIEYGKVPHPDFQDRIIPNSQNSAWDDLGKRTVRAVVWHRMLGSLAGTDGYFRGEGGSRALTDYGVGVLAQDGANLDGVIYRWNDPQGHRSPWANGSVSAPYGDGLAFVNRFGVNGVNRDATAIEISGFEQTSLSTKSRAAICGITAYWADQAKIPWDTFPAVPGENRSFVVWHEEFTIGTGKRCPFDLVKGETNALIEQTRAILKQHQTGSTTTPPKPPKYADPIVPDWVSDDLKNGYPTDHKLNGVDVFAVLRTYEATKKTKRLQKPDHTGPIVGPPIEVRERFRANYRVVVKDAKGVNRGYVLTPYGTWVQDSALTPRVAIRKA